MTGKVEGYSADPASTTVKNNEACEPFSVATRHKRTFTNFLKKALRNTKYMAGINMLRKYPRV